MVELAIIFPIFLILLFGIIEFSLIMYNKVVLTNASREGARAGIVAQSRLPADITNINLGIRKVVKDYARAYLITFGQDKLGGTAAEDITDIPITWEGATFGMNLTVEVNYRYEFLVLSRLLSLVSALGGPGPIILNAITVMKLE